MRFVCGIFCSYDAHERTSARTLLVKSWLTHELDPKFICCSVQGRGAGEKGGRGGTNKKKEKGGGERKREKH